MRFARSPDTNQLRGFLASVSDAPLTYPERGASLAELPPGYRHDHHVVALGTGDETMRRAIQALREWRAHRATNVTVFPSEAPLEVGTTVALSLPLLGADVLAACRIVAVVSEPDRFGFAYGTVDGHPERGEEAFTIEREDGSVRFRIAAFSKPADVLARLGAPVARRIQLRVTRAYLAGLRAAVED